jgi:hypothetical protein
VEGDCGEICVFELPSLFHTPTNHVGERECTRWRHRSHRTTNNQHTDRRRYAYYPDGAIGINCTYTTTVEGRPSLPTAPSEQVSNTTTVEGRPSLPTAPSEQVYNTTSVEGRPSLPTAPSEQVSNTTTAASLPPVNTSSRGGRARRNTTSERGGRRGRGRARGSNTTTVEGGPSLPTAPSEQVSNTTAGEDEPSLPTAPSEQVSHTTSGEDGPSLPPVNTSSRGGRARRNVLKDAVVYHNQISNLISIS